MIWIAGVLGVIALIALLIGFKTRLLGVVLVSAVALLIAVGMGVASAVYTQGVGEAKVLINPGGTVAGADTTPGISWKSPLQSSEDFDLFSQQLTYAGGGDGGPSYSGGDIQGQEVTVSVQGGTQANVDVSVVYAVDANKVLDVYNQFRSQENFTKQVVEKTILSTLREVPASYTATDFRAKQSEVAKAVLDKANKELTPLGVTVDFVNIQDIRYGESVEESLKAAAVAAQNVETEKNNLEAQTIKAQQQVVEAQAEADANRLLGESLTAEVLESRRIDALREAGSVYVVPEGSTPFVQVQGGSAPVAEPGK